MNIEVVSAAEVPQKEKPVIGWAKQIRDRAMSAGVGYAVKILQSEIPVKAVHQHIQSSRHYRFKVCVIGGYVYVSYLGPKEAA